MVYIDGDFLNCQKPLVVFATADLKMTTPLLITMEREMGAQEFLFNQRKGVGQVAIMPRITTMTKNYVFHLFGKMNIHERITYPALRECIRSLLSEVRRLRIQEIALPSRDSVRDGIPWFQIYDAFKFYKNLQVLGISSTFSSFPLMAVPLVLCVVVVLVGVSCQNILCVANLYSNVYQEFLDESF